jgi:hypothetical protein
MVKKGQQTHIAFSFLYQSRTSKFFVLFSRHFSFREAPEAFLRKSLRAGQVPVVSTLNMSVSF